MEVLFEARPDISYDGGRLQTVCARPRISDEPVLVGDTFVDSAGASIYGSVLRDAGVWRMWYTCWPKTWNGEDTHFVGYAESDNGLDWRKPVLHLVECNGTSNHLCDLGLGSPAVYIDPDSPAQSKYCAVGCGDAGAPGSHPDATVRGYYSAHSPDGLHWTLDATTPTWRGADVISAVFHPGRERSLAAMKCFATARSIRRRSVCVSEKINGGWTEPAVALVPDDFDDARAVDRGGVSADFYRLGLLPAGRGVVGFLHPFRHTPPLMHNPPYGLFGAVDISLVWQPGPGAAWLHPSGRPDFLRHEDVPWGPGGIYTASCPVETGGDHWLYITGAARPHGWCLGADHKVIEKRKRELIEKGMSRIGLARWPAWRLFGFRAKTTGELNIDLGEIARPVELELNCTAEADGAVRVELLADSAIGGRGREDAVPLIGDHLRAVTAWNTGTLIAPTRDRQVTARVLLDRATVWAFKICPK